MFQLSQQQVNELVEVLEYAKTRVQHPESGLIQLCGDTAYRQFATAAQIRQEADRRIKTIEEYERFRSLINEYLTVLKSFDYAAAMDGTEITSAIERKAATLGEILSEPDKFAHLGKREQETQS